MVTQTFAELGIDTKGRNAGHVKTRCPQCAGSRKPAHRNDTPLSVNISEGVFLCHNCGFTGSLDKSSWQAQVGHQKTYVKPVVSSERRLGPRARTFLAARKIDPDIAIEAGVYSNPEDTAIAIPYFQDGEIVHVKYRAITEKRFWSTKDTELVMYGLDDCVNADTVIVCEGEMDRLALICAGFNTVLSVPNGAIAPGTNPGAKLDCLASAERIFTKARKVIIATDGDDPGEALADELRRRIGPEKCWRVKFPNDSKDANDVLATSGAEVLCDTIDQARPSPVVGIYDGDDFEDDLIRMYRQGRDKGFSFGYPILDSYYTVLPGYMTVVTGHAGHGKSTALDQLLVKLAERYDWHITVFSPEQQPLVWHQAQLIEQYMGFPFWDGPSPRLTENEMLTANRWVRKHFSFVLPEEPTIDSILELAKIQIYRTGAQGMVIDPWNELEHARPASLSETEYVSVVLRRLRSFARNHNLHLWLVAHPTKMPMNDLGEEQVPGLGNISGSNNFRNKADFGISVWRDLKAPDNPVDIVITKTRRIDAAKLGRVRFQFDPVTKRLREVGVVNQ